METTGKISSSSVSKIGHWRSSVVCPSNVMRGRSLTFSSEKHSSRRSMFLLPNASPDGMKGKTTASNSRASGSTTVEKLVEYPSGIDATTVKESEIARESGSSLLPQVSTPTRAVPPRTLIPPPLIGQPSAVTSQSLGDTPMVSAPPQVFETPGFIAPQVFLPPQSLEPTKSHPVNVPPMIVASPVTTTTVTGSPQPVVPNQAVVFTTAHEADRPAAPPVLEFEFSQTVTPDQTAISPTVRESASLTTPAPSLVLESSQPVVTNQVVVSPTIISQEPVSLLQAADPPHVIRTPQPVVAHSSPNLAGGITGDDSGATVVNKAVYKLRDSAGAVTANRTRRDSIEEAPGVMLSLCGSGYELVNPSSQQVPRDKGVSTLLLATPSFTVSSTPSPDELVVPSSQQSLEEYLTIPVDIEAVISTPASATELTVPLSRQPVEEPLTTPAATSEMTTTARGRFAFSPRVIPTYTIDQSDFPSWLLESGRLNLVLSVEGGELWKKLIVTWLRQEKRLGFGLNEQLVSEIALVYCHTI